MGGNEGESEKGKSDRGLRGGEENIFGRKKMEDRGSGNSESERGGRGARGGGERGEKGERERGGKGERE